MARVELDRISKVYEGKGQEAVREVSLTVEPGELLVLVGPSGCGKSTLLRMIAGLEEITSGELRIDGRRVNDVPPKDRDVAMVFQNYALYPHMTVFDNMAFGLKLRKTPAPEIKERVGATARLLGLDGYLDRKPRALSGGERQRVALGRALVRRPRLFLFDEPLSNLDAKLRTHTRAEIARLHHQLTTTMIYVTHDQVEAMTLGQRIAVLDRGRLQQIDDPMTVYRRPANRFVAGFIGSPAMNFLDATLGDGGSTIEVGGRRLPVPPQRRVATSGARPVVLGVRPEHFGIGGGESAIPATVAVREPLGNEVLLHADTPAGEVVVRLQRDGGPAVGEAVGLVPDLGEAHLFDPESGAVLGA